MLHPFEFDYVFFEAVPNKSLKELADECIKSKRSQVVLSLNYAIWAGLYKHYANFTSYNFCAYLPVFLRTNKVEEFISWKRKIKQKSHGIDRIDNHCTHVGSVVDFAVLSGYKNIVLVGVDLNGGKYFTEVENEDISAETEKRYVTYNKARVSFLKEKGQYDAKLHPSMMKNDTLTAYDYFKTMQKELESNGIRLSVSSKNSLLSDFLPIADI